MPLPRRSWLLGALCGTVCVLTLSGCKPTVEGENRKWSGNKAAVDEYASRWPGFATVLKDKRTEAENLMKASDAVQNDDARAQAMQAANKILAPLVGKMQSVSSGLTDLDRAMNRLDRLKLSPSEKRSVRGAMERADQTMGDVARAMDNAKPSSESEATRILDEQISRLSKSERECKKLFDELSKPAHERKAVKTGDRI